VPLIISGGRTIEVIIHNRGTSTVHYFVEIAGYEVR